jgi:protoheme IX farnesyltransferase
MNRFQQFYALTKPRVVQLIVFCALIGMALALQGLPDRDQWQHLIAGCVGIWLVASAAAAFNCLVEKGIDAKMRRTAWRPTARGELSDWQTLGFATVLCAIGSYVLYQWVNPLTMWLTLGTFVGYAVIYTVILKPLTPQNIVIGGASGAMPPVLGWAAITGDVGPEALILFLIIFLWTPPHFWALALFRTDDYARAEVPMLPVVAGADATRLQILLYTIVLVGVAIAPWPLGYFSVVYGATSAVLGAAMLWLAVRVYRDRTGSPALRASRGLFKFSILYLFALFAVLLSEVMVKAAARMIWS